MTHDGCRYVAGGGTSITLAKNLLHTPENISKNVTRERMEKVLLQLNSEFIKKLNQGKLVKMVDHPRRSDGLEECMRSFFTNHIMLERCQSII